ncbi:(2Fe-2S)-binding protein [Mycoplasmatota bacterium]|nr:(2Fe-2S)-binding protein [Mycoplasmatota bacterium]
MKIKIDGKIIDISNENRNLVEIARDHKIAIPAPCYLNDRKYGCCNACVVRINGEISYACTIYPKDGMDIITSTKELKDLRKQRIREYQESIETGNYQSCCGDECNCSSDSDNSCC